MGMIDNITTIVQVVLISVIVIAVIGGAILYYMMNKKNDNKTPEKVVKKVDPNIAKEKIAGFLPFDSIEENMIMMDQGDKFVMLIGANGVNYYLMSDVEKEAIEGGFIQILNSLRFPIQIYVQTTSVNLDKSLEIYKDRRKVMEDNLVSRAQNLQYLIREGETSREELSEKRLEIEKFKNVYDYTQDLILNTENITLNQWIIKKNYYIVIPYYLSESGMINRFTPDEVKTIAQQELETRATSIIDGLSNIGVDAHIVDSTELKQVVYSALNREDADIFTFERAKDAEFDSLFKTTKKAYENMNIDKSKLSKGLFDFDY
ncbi:MAG: hypothetical protein E7314_01135 [Clostridiales bacterium]|nr:hypothetical protein [Clostridiales bacterium]